MRITPISSLILCGALLAACGSHHAGTSGGASSEDDPEMASYNEGLPDKGATLPSISAKTLDGKPVTNESLHGKTVLLNLWFFH